MMYLIFFAGGMLFAFSICLIIKLCRKEGVVTCKEKTEMALTDLTLQDLIHLVSAGSIVWVNSLMDDFEVAGKMPEFHEKYQLLNRDTKEYYFQELIRVLGKNKRGYIENLVEHHPEFSTQDRLLLLMCEMELDNKTMSRIMLSNLDTLKKRKTRLRAKIREKAPELNHDKIMKDVVGNVTL